MISSFKTPVPYDAPRTGRTANAVSWWLQEAETDELDYRYFHGPSRIGHLAFYR
jgi:hypothetical protein